MPDGSLYSVPVMTAAPPPDNRSMIERASPTELFALGVNGLMWGINAAGAGVKAPS
jgi:hypothetical protein